MASAFFGNLLVFARVLRNAGLAVRTNATPDAAAALADVGVRNKADVRAALRSVFVCRFEDFRRFDELFDGFWRSWAEAGGDRSLPRPLSIPPRMKTSLQLTAPGPAASLAGDEGPVNDGGAIARRTYSADETWRRKDFTAFTAEDVDRAQDAIAQLAWNPGVRVTRRWIGGRGQALDFRRLLRANAKHGGELLTLPRRVRRVQRRPLILLCDVSGSMEPYARILLLFVHAISRGGRRVEVFMFSTRLSRVTREFAAARVDQAVANVQQAVRDWSGGTRIGEAVRQFNVTWARRVLRHQPVLLFISDGWDLGDPGLLGREVARLQRSVHRLIWLNPLIGSPGYQPLARGMHAALPFVDDFLPVRNMSSLEALAARLDALSPRHSRQAPIWN
jgi:uncharacterized protein with von Willebrand factor type A (vWA) domain